MSELDEDSLDRLLRSIADATQDSPPDPEAASRWADRAVQESNWRQHSRVWWLMGVAAVILAALGEAWALAELDSLVLATLQLNLSI